MPVNLTIPTLGNRFVDYRQDIPGDSFNWGPEINASKVKYFAFHHSVTAQTAKNDGNWKRECDIIANLHIGQGWGGVGYRFLIASNGIVAYVGDLSHGGSAVTGNNDIIFSACMIGDFTKELPTDAQIHSAHDLAQFFISSMPQYPLINSWETSVIGHKDSYSLLHLPGSTPTACPGTSWPNDMKDRIKNNIQYSPVTQPTPPQPPTPQPVPIIPTPAPTPVITPPVSPDTLLLNQVREIIWGKGQLYVKINKLKALLPK